VGHLMHQKDPISHQRIAILIQMHCCHLQFSHTIPTNQLFAGPPIPQLIPIANTLVSWFPASQPQKQKCMNNVEQSYRSLWSNNSIWCSNLGKNYCLALIGNYNRPITFCMPIAKRRWSHLLATLPSIRWNRADLHGSSHTITKRCDGEWA